MKLHPAPWFILLALASAAPAAHAAASRSDVLHPDKLVILSTTDVKGKIQPCGCHTPKGGLSRRATFADSMRNEFGQVLVLDNGGFFPEVEDERDYSWFLMDAMKLLGTDAVGVGDRDLKLGLQWLREHQARTQLPLTSANLRLKSTGKPVFASSIVRKVGNVRVGIFGLTSDKVDLGPARDSLIVDPPAVAAPRAIAELRRKGAQVVVMLSQLGKVETEDLVTSIDGVDVVLVGRNAPLLQKGRRIKDAVLTFGGEQGHYFARTLLSLDSRGRPTAGESEVFMLGPSIVDKPQIADVVRAFESRVAQKKDQAKPAANDHDGHDHSGHAH